MVVFLVSGLWHGAKWTFVIWGALHGIYMVIGKYTYKSRTKLLNTIGLKREYKVVQLISILITYTLFMYAFMIFRADSLVQAYELSSRLLQIFSEKISLGVILANLQMTFSDFKVLSMILLLFLGIEIVGTKVDIIKWVETDILSCAGYVISH